ncbi:unnamed protein product [Peniophora sp. CBMAI 1063]|nr:unnamed protein product [Peniophora sp. CBMAI 1063]
MFASVLAPLALLAPLAAAEIIVNVGVNNSLLFDPPQVFTEPGETITFVFHSNHTATQSTFANPCTQLDGGFNTGFLSNNQSASVRVNGTDPIWMYCAVGMHCEYGMVFAVNPTPSQPYDFFHAKAGLLLNATTAATNATNATSSTVVPATSPTAGTFTFATATAATSAATDAATTVATDSAASAATSAVASAAASAATDSASAATSAASAATSAAPATSAVTAAATSAATSAAAATDSAATSAAAATDSAAATTSAAASLGAAPRVGLAGASDAVTSFASASASATDAAFAAVTTVAGETPVVIVAEQDTEVPDKRRWMQREVAFSR